MGTIFAGVELGGTKCVCILARGPQEIIERRTVPTEDPDGTFAAIRTILRTWRADHDVTALGIASFGPLDLAPGSARFGRITSTPKHGWSDADPTLLAEGLPFAIDTDVNGAALAEGRWGAAQNLDTWCYITVGTGVGVGTVIAGQPLHGLGHSEAGHMRIPLAGGVEGACPFHGPCVEGLVSGPALAARTGMAAGQISDDHPVWHEVARELAWLCHNLVCTVAPQRIVLGGGVMQRRAHLLPAIRSGLIDSLGSYAGGAIIAESIEDYLVPPGLGDDAGPLGAIALARMAMSA